MLSRYDVVNAVNPSLYERPEAFDGVRVDIPTYVDLRRVVNPLVEVTHAPDSLIGLPFVSVDHGAGQYALSDNGQKGSPGRVRNFPSDHSALPLNDLTTWKREMVELSGVRFGGVGGSSR